MSNVVLWKTCSSCNWKIWTHWKNTVLVKNRKCINFWKWFFIYILFSLAFELTLLTVVAIWMIARSFPASEPAPSCSHVHVPALSIPSVRISPPCPSLFPSFSSLPLHWPPAVHLSAPLPLLRRSVSHPVPAWISAMQFLLSTGKLQKSQQPVS